MKKIFVSLPFKGRTLEEIRAKQEEVMKKFPNDELIDTIVTDAPQNSGKLYFLGKSIEFMDKADIVYFVAGWSSYNGCIIENEVARRYQKVIMYETELNA